MIGDELHRWIVDCDLMRLLLIRLEVENQLERKVVGCGVI